MINCFSSMLSCYYPPHDERDFEFGLEGNGKIKITYIDKGCLRYRFFSSTEYPREDSVQHIVESVILKGRTYPSLKVCALVIRCQNGIYKYGSKENEKPITPFQAASIIEAANMEPIEMGTIFARTVYPSYPLASAVCNSRFG